MKSRSSLFFRRLALACLLTGWAAGATAAEKPAPQVSVSLRGVEAQSIGQGEPWRVMVRVDLPRGSQGTVELAPASGTWTDALAVELLPATGLSVAARAEPMGKPDAATATLDAKHVAGGLWRFSPEAMQAVVPGAYRLRVQLKIDSGRGWKGIAAREIPLTVVALATKPAAQRVANRAQDLLLTGGVQEAATLVDAELKTSPRDYSLLKVRAQIAERAGNPLAAIMCLNAANFSAVRKLGGPPPAEDIELRERFEKSRRAVVPSAPPPPAWSWPPAEVLLALSEEAKKSGFIPAMPPERAQSVTNDTAPRSTNPTNPVSTTAQTSPAATPSLPPRAPTPPASASVTTPVPAAPAEPSPGVIVPSTELNDAKISADTAGQWAATATARTQYDRNQYSAARATGAPNVTVAGNSPDAWCPSTRDQGMDWLELTFAKPVHAVEVRVRQNDAPGAIAKIEAIEPDGTAHVWWEGVDPYQRSAVREIVWFAVRVPKTSYLVARVKLTLNLASGPGYKEIDAVQLVAAAEDK
jgi:hypothetical protein